MSAFPFSAPKPQFFDANGDPLANGTVEFRTTGGGSLASIYSNFALTVAASNPVTLNARGEAPTPIYLAYDTPYQVILRDALGATIYTLDPYRFGNQIAVSAADSYVLRGAGSPEGVVTAPVGTIWLRTNGGAATTFYVKESGTGNTGWVAK